MKIHSDRQKNNNNNNSQKVPPIMVSSEMVYPPSLYGGPIKEEIHEENIPDIENEFRPKSSIF